MKIKIITVDDHEIFRKGLNLILNQLPGTEVIGEASNGKEYLDLLKKIERPDIVFTDIRMPVMDGIEATKNALQIYPELKIIAISMFGEERYLEHMITAGAKGFLLKNIEKTELEMVIRQVMKGSHYYSPELLPYFTRKFIGNGTNEGMDITFSQREFEILKFVSKGLTSKEIGEKLFISKRTVEGHKAKMIEKTGSRNIIELLIYAIKNNFVKI